MNMYLQFISFFYTEILQNVELAFKQDKSIIILNN